jgi:hypothetical protein
MNIKLSWQNIAAIAFVFFVAFGLLIMIIFGLKKDLEEAVEKNQKQQRLIELSEFYSVQAHKIWGGKSGRCSIGLIQSVDTLVVQYGQERVTTETVLAIMTIESGFNERAKSSTNAYGLMQLVISTAKSHEKNVTPNDLYQPVTNIRIGIKEFARLVGKFEGNKELALLGYNRGPAGAMSFALNDVSKDDYVRKVIANNYRIAQAMKNM